MKKIAILSFLALSVLALSGCSFPSANKQEPLTQSAPVEEDKNVFSSIRDAMNKSLSLKCEYADRNGKQTALIKGQAIRVNGIFDENGPGGVIYKENKMWSWSGNEGITIDLSQKQLSENNQNQTQMTEEDMVAQLEEQKQNCQIAIIEDSMFAPPKEVNFQDMTQILKQFTQ